MIAQGKSMVGECRSYEVGLRRVKDDVALDEIVRRPEAMYLVAHKNRRLKGIKWLDVEVERAC